MKRTFHPVGQGAFYSETHDCNRDKFTIVYDCGSLTDKGIHMKSIIESAFKKKESEKKPIIDILFISHFHADHINGIKYLKTHCEIKKVVIPLIDDFTKIVLKINNHLVGDPADDILIDDPRSFFGKAVEIIAIRENGNENQTSNDSEIAIYPSGRKFTTNKSDNWYFIPFNYKHDTSVDLFRESLKELGIDINHINIDDIDDNQAIITEYKKINNDLNKNSMILYSGKDCDDFLEFNPQKTPSNTIVDKIRKIKYYRYFMKTQSGCLYTGDIDLKQRNIVTDIKTNLQQFFPFIGTIQIPHHGSKASYRNSILAKTMRHAVISHGTINSYKHPSTYVTADIKRHCISVHKVTEEHASIFKQNNCSILTLRKPKLKKIMK